MVCLDIKNGVIYNGFADTRPFYGHPIARWRLIATNRVGARLVPTARQDLPEA